MFQIHACSFGRILSSLKARYLIIFVSIMAGLAARPAAQTAPLLPAVELRTSSSAFTGDVWPADANRDGVTDLVGGTGNGIAVALGNGDGTFAVPVASTTAGQVLTVRDVNGDGMPDVVAKNDSQLILLAGTGSAALAAPRVVMDGQFFTFATVADMDNDGLRDLVVGQEGMSLHIFPGNGDLTFDPPFTQTTAAWPFGHIVVDLDGDGLRDIVVAHRYEWRVIVFRNGGSFGFTGTDIPLGRSSSDVTAHDLNGDAAIDLVVSARGESDDGPWSEGFVYVFLGNGDGTFRAPATFATTRGTESVVVGDFTRDGKTDVATTNRSFSYADVPCGFAWGIDSVSLLPGRGDGTFGTSIDFALGPVVPWFEAYRDKVGTLNTSDLNGDRHVDLITSHGRILLNAAPRANRPPIVFAGDDRTVYDEPQPYVQGMAEDPDHHLLRVKWSQGAAVAGDGPIDTCVETPPESGTYVFHLTADDGQGGVTSDDVNITQVHTEGWPDVSIGEPTGTTITEGTPTRINWYAFDEDGLARVDLFFSSDGGATFEPVDGCTELPGSATECIWNRPGPPTERARLRVRVFDNRGEQGESSGDFVIAKAGPAGVPAPWTSQDVGAVGVKGSASFDSTTGTFTVRGSGADVWGTADEFHWMRQPWNGDFEMTAHVSAVDGVDVWTKAGLMVREGRGAGARHASLFVTPTTRKGIAFQRRPAANGASLHTSRTGDDGACLDPGHADGKRDQRLRQSCRHPRIVDAHRTADVHGVERHRGHRLRRQQSPRRPPRGRDVRRDGGEHAVLVHRRRRRRRRTRRGRFQRLSRGRRYSRIGHRHLGNGGRIPLPQHAVDARWHGHGAGPQRRAYARLGQGRRDVPRDAGGRLEVRHADRVAGQRDRHAVPIRNGRHLVERGAADGCRARMAQDHAHRQYLRGLRLRGWRDLANGRFA